MLMLPYVIFRELYLLEVAEFADKFIAANPEEAWRLCHAEGDVAIPSLPF